MATSKTISNPQKSASTRRRVWALSRYVLGLDIDSEIEKCLGHQCHGFLSDEPLKQIYEMQIFAQASRHSSDPIHHQVVSFASDESVSIERFHDIVDEYIAFYKFGQHQVIAGLHQDTDNLHIHFVVNRYNHYKNKVVSINGGFDRHLGALFCAHLETKFAFSPSENAAAYCIGDQYVLSDLYNADSAAAHIKNNEVKFGDVSARDVLARDIPPILQKSTSWSKFIKALHKAGIDVLQGPRGGLVYSLYIEDQKPIFVAASRVSKILTPKHLEMRFKAPFPKTSKHNVKPRSTSWYSKLMKSVLTTQAKDEETSANYARYSQPKPGKVELLAKVQNALTRLASVFAFGHVMFTKTFGGGSARTHVIDRARGDPSALHMTELDAFTANIAEVIGRKYAVEFVSPADADVVTLVGPSDALPALHDRGLFPNVVQTSGDNTARFLFTSITSLPDPNLAHQEITAALDDIPGVRRDPNNGVEFARDGEVRDFEIMAAPARPDILQSARLQFLSPLQKRVSKLQQTVDALRTVFNASHLMKHGVSRHINASLTQRKGQDDNDLDRRNPRGPVDGYAGAGRPLRPALGRASRDDGSPPGAGSAARRERNRRTSGHAGRTDDYVSGAVGSIQNDARAVRGDGTAARKQDRHTAKVRRGDAQTADDAHAEIRADQIKFRDPRPGNQYWRMLRATLIAEKHAFETAWSDEKSGEIQILSASKRETPRQAICLLTDTEVKILQPVPAEFGDELGATLELPILRAPKPGPVRVPKTGPIGAKEKPTSAPLAPPHPETVHQVIYDPEHLITVGDLDSEQILMHSADEIDSLELSDQVDLIFAASDMFKPQLAADVKAIESAIKARKIELLKTEIYVPENSPTFEPRAIVFIIDPPEHHDEQEWDDDVLIVPVSPDGTLGCSEPVCFDALHSIVFALPAEGASENQHRVIDDLKSKMESLTSCLATHELIELSEISGDYEDTINSLKKDDGTSPGF